MRRLAPVLLMLATACSGGGGDSPTGPAPVASVSISSPVTSLNVGQTATLSAVARDAQGTVLPGRAVAWSSSSAGVASVTSGGVVTALSLGTTIITATVESKSSQAPIVVTNAGPDCAAAAPLSLAVGDVRVLSSAERALLCLPGGASGAEYALIPVNLGTGAGAISVEAVSANTVAPTGGPAALLAPAPVQGMARPSFAIAGASAPGPRPPRSYGFERALRERERVMRRTARDARSAPAQGRAPLRPARGARAAIIDLPATPAVGTLVTLNASSTNACTVPLNRVARVAAVSNTAIVVVDTSAPAGGFSDAEFLSVAVTFDTLIFVIDTAAFGAPFDMDNNGRILLFFTTAVNQLTSPTSTSVIGGFFFERDIVPRVANAIVPFGCPTSNEGEMFYLPVVDVNSVFNPYFRSKAAMLLDVNSTTVHEFQHLINASTRYYITPEIVESEETWLGEGMSHLAEELLYLRVAGLGSKADLGYQITTQPPFRLAAINAYQVDNLARFSDYLKATDLSSPYAADDALATRGAGWALLRFALDQSPNPPNTYLRALVRAPTQGIPNFNNVFASIGGLAGAVRDLAVANFTDNAGFSVAVRYTQPSWDFRDLLPRLPSNSARYPLSTRSLVSGVSQSFALGRGSSGYLRFRVAAGGVGGVRTTSNGASLSASVDLLVVRTQ